MIIAFYLSGIATATFGLAGLFFLKFWKVSRDRFFLYLCAACWLLTTERMVGLFTHLALGGENNSMEQVRSWLYLFRMAAFVAIFLSIVEKNRSADRR